MGEIGEDQNLDLRTTQLWGLWFDYLKQLTPDPAEAVCAPDNSAAVSKLNGFDEDMMNHSRIVTT